MIGIIVADSNELNKFSFPRLREEKSSGFIFNIYKINEEEVVVVHSGIGIANAAAATQELITKYGPRVIYNYGAVGGDDTVKVYDLITPKKIYYHDIMTPWYERGHTPNEKPYFKNSLQLKNTNNLASGSSFLSSKMMIDEVKQDLDVNIFDMEAAAILQIAGKTQTPVKVIKCVSDSIGNTDTELEEINTRIEKAGKLAFDVMIEEIKK